MKTTAIAIGSLILLTSSTLAADQAPALTLTWDKNILTIHGEHLPGKDMKVLYLEAYCRADSHDTDWSKHTVVGHTTELISSNDSHTEIKLRCTLTDGVVVDHTITASEDDIDFSITANNPTDKPSEAHWAQPCIRVGEFTGTGPEQTDDKYAYVKHGFIFLDGELARLPTNEWATEARYTPGQVWAGPGVPRDDVNPRPLNKLTPSNGLIGCFSADDKMLMATAFEPYQELFQGVIRCLHADFRLGGLKPGETKHIRGKIYLMANDVDALLKRYEKDFPDQVKRHEEAKKKSAD